jgi:hypothetical protein
MDDAKGGVKVLSEKTGSDENFQDAGGNFEKISMKRASVSDEFRDLFQIN